jgi:hypothetical protein
LYQQCKGNTGVTDPTGAHNCQSSAWGLGKISRCRGLYFDLHRNGRVLGNIDFQLDQGLSSNNMYLFLVEPDCAISTAVNACHCWLTDLDLLGVATQW